MMKEPAKGGLKINTQKTKLMSTHDTRENNITLNNTGIEQV